MGDGSDRQAGATVPILCASRETILDGVDLDPRRRHLHGGDVAWLPTGEFLDGGLSEGAKAPMRARIQAAMEGSGRVLIVGDHATADALVGSGVRFVFDPTDSAALYHVRRARALIGRHPVKALNSLRQHLSYRAAERRIAESAAMVLTTGPADEVFLRRLAPGAAILRVGNGTPLVAEPPVAPRDDGATIGFHGGMTWEPNRMAAMTVAGPVARALARDGGPSLRIRIAGRPVMDRLAARDGQDGVEVCGFVEDLRGWMASLSLYVMPMQQGAGVKNKLIEAMALGLPVLTNARGAEALDEEGRRAVAVVQADRDLVPSIRALLADPARRAALRRDARLHAEARFRWEDHRARLHAGLRRLAAAGRL